MITTKKIIASAMLALAMLGLTTSLPAFADGAYDTSLYCVACHDGMTVTSASGTVLGVVGGGARSCPQRTVTEWVATVERMNGKGCGVPPNSISGIANYLAGLGVATTTTSTTTSTAGSTTTSSSTSTTTSTTTTSTTLNPSSYDMRVSLTGSTCCLTQTATGPSWHAEFDISITNNGPGTGVADVLFNYPGTIDFNFFSYFSNCVQTGPSSCRATLLPGQNIFTATRDYFSATTPNVTLSVSVTDVAGDGQTETNIANNSAMLTLQAPTIYTGPAAEAVLYCTGCHDGVVITNNLGQTAVIGGGARSAPQRTADEWIATFYRMNGTGARIPVDRMSDLANYLAGLIPLVTVTTTSTTSTSTTSTSSTTTGTNHVWCINQDGQTYPEPSGSCPTNICYYADGTTTLSPYGGRCPIGTNYFPPPTCTDGLPTLSGTTWICPAATSTTSTTVSTVATTTTSTLCNTYVNGTTQYPYSGSGSCHGHPDNDSSSGHVVRDQKWCRKHMTHFNSNGNHTHAYPHPMCM